MIQRKALCLALLLCSAGAQAQDGRALLQKMFTAYGTLNTYSQTSSSTLIRKAASQQRLGGFSIVLRYARPNRLYISLTNPRTGTVIGSCDGRQLILYSSLRNVYQKKPAPPDITGVLRGVEAYGIAGEMDPLSFLQGPPPMGSLSNIVARRAETINGVKCHVVQASFRSRVHMPRAMGRAVFYIDQGSNLLRKVQIAFKMPAVATVQTVEKGRIVQKRQNVIFEQVYTQVIQDMKVNAPLDNTAFSFTPPKDAVEQNLERLLGK